MSRSKATAARYTQSEGEKRIIAYVFEHWPNVRAAAEALKVEHTTLWRTMKGNNERGPSMAIITALADHSGKSTDYFLGRGE